MSPLTHLTAKGSNGKNQTETQDRHTFVKICLFCKGGHTLELCSMLDKKSDNEKISFFKRNGICFGCL